MYMLSVYSYLSIQAYINNLHIVFTKWSIRKNKNILFSQKLEQKLLKWLELCCHSLSQCILLCEKQRFSLYCFASVQMSEEETQNHFSVSLGSWLL